MRPLKTFFSIAVVCCVVCPWQWLEAEELQLSLKEHLLKGFNPRHCAPEWDELKLRKWADVNIAILYAPCYGHSSDLKNAFLFTLKFDGAGNWKITKTHQMSKKELGEEQ